MATSDTEFKHTTLTADTFINKSCAIYGRSGSGKTVIIKHILFLVRDYNPVTIVFSLSEKNNNTYSKALVPRCLVHDSVTPEAICAIAERQTHARKIYERANKISILDMLFARVANEQQRQARAEMQRIFDEIASQRPIDEETENKFNDRVISFIHGVIIPRMAELSRADLSEEEKFSLQWCQFNPRVTIVFDDCSTDLQKMRQCAEALELIFQGRHGFCTTIMAAHGEVCLTPTARANITASFYTDQATAKQFASRPTNALGREKRAEIMRYAEQIRATNPPVPPHTKMFYANDQPLLVEVAMHEAFSAVSAEVRAFCERVTKKDEGSMEPWMKSLVT